MKPRKEYWKEPIWIRRSKTDIPLKWPQLSPSPRPRWWSTIGRIQLEGSRVKSSVWCSNFRAVLWIQIWFWWYFECERTHFQRGVEWLVMAVQMCYNRGCGKEYNIRQNFEDSCRWKGQKHRPIENLAQNHHHNAGIILVIPIFTMPTRVGAVVRFWTFCKCDLINCICFFSEQINRLHHIPEHTWLCSGQAQQCEADQPREDHGQPEQGARTCGGRDQTPYSAWRWNKEVQSRFAMIITENRKSLNDA